jgi:hypothetical protein
MVGLLKMASKTVKKTCVTLFWNTNDQKKSLLYFLFFKSNKNGGDLRIGSEFLFAESFGMMTFQTI